jgi:hypothetical protein
VEKYVFLALDSSKWDDKSASGKWKKALCARINGGVNLAIYL